MSIHQNDYFSLHLQQEALVTQLTMQVYGEVLSTNALPHTRSMLKSHLPSILRSKCFNENNYSFAKEVKSTEIGHLFEHILLEYLCLLKIAAGKKHSIHNGLTRWNWKEDARGTFHITIDVGQKDSEFLTTALQKSVRLTTRILQRGQLSSSFSASRMPLRLDREN